MVICIMFQLWRVFHGLPLRKPLLCAVRNRRRVVHHYHHNWICVGLYSSTTKSYANNIVLRNTNPGQILPHVQSDRLWGRRVSTIFYFQLFSWLFLHEIVIKGQLRWDVHYDWLIDHLYCCHYETNLSGMYCTCIMIVLLVYWPADYCQGLQ